MLHFNTLLQNNLVLVHRKWYHKMYFYMRIRWLAPVSRFLTGLIRGLEGCPVLSGKGRCRRGDEEKEV